MTNGDESSLVFLFLVWLFILLYGAKSILGAMVAALFMWLGLLMHYTMAYRRWNKEMNIRREERRKIYWRQNVLSEENE